MDKNDEMKNNKLAEEEFLNQSVSSDASKNNSATADNFSGANKNENDKYSNVKSKISKLLQSQGIEIIDENEGDEYEFEASEDGETAQTRQDAEELISVYAEAGKKKKKELELTFDNFDYTYIGQYLDEFDLLHMKNIKKVKLKRNITKRFRLTIISIIVAMVAILGAVMTYFIVRPVPVYLKNVSLNQTERVYYLDEVFDYTGLYFIEEYSDGSIKKVPLTSEYLDNIATTGQFTTTNDNIQFRDGSLANFVFRYKGFTLNYKVNIRRKNAKTFYVIFSDGIFNLSENDYITSDIMKIMVYYEGFGIEEVKDVSAFTLSIGGIDCTYDSNRGEFKVSTNTSGKVITIKSAAGRIGTATINDSLTTSIVQAVID